MKGIYEMQKEITDALMRQYGAEMRNLYGDVDMRPRELPEWITGGTVPPVTLAGVVAPTPGRSSAVLRVALTEQPADLSAVARALGIAPDASVGVIVGEVKHLKKGETDAVQIARACRRDAEQATLRANATVEKLVNENYNLREDLLDSDRENGDLLRHLSHYRKRTS